MIRIENKNREAELKRLNDEDDKLKLKLKDYKEEYEKEHVPMY